MVNSLCIESLNFISSREGGGETYLSQNTDPFTAESELIEKFELITKSRFNNKSGFVSELNAGNGIADIAVYRQRKDWISYSSLANIKPQWVYSLIMLPYRKLFDEYHFSKIACVSDKTARLILKEFSKAGFCKQTKNGWTKIKQPRAPISHIYAIEAKLRNWKRALYQATRYLEFAQQSWVLLDSYYCKPAIENKDQFQRRNIGLMTIDSSGEMSILINAVTKPPLSSYRYWYANTVILNQNLKRCTP